jgi:peroxiredoxin
VIKIERERGALQKLWIDLRTHLIRRDMQQDAKDVTDVVFQTAQLENTPRAKAFAYDPALTDAQDRRRLSQQAPETLVGKQAPDFALEDSDGKVVRLADFKGRAVILDFWATWCGPCREALPVLELLHRTFAGRGLVVLGVNTEDAQIARGFLRKEGYTIRSLADAKERVTSAYKVVPLPTTVVIDREGRIAFYQVGAGPTQLRDAVSKLGLW